MPRTHIHTDPFNEIHRRLGHQVKVDRAAGWFYYKSGQPHSQLLVDAKYSGLPQIARVLGKRCATELVSDGFFDTVDVLVPMPIHYIKRLKRGYNQAEEICRGVSEVTALPVQKALRAVKSHGVQSRHARHQRFTSIEGTFGLRDKADLGGKHVLLVDDIITSGASMQEALRAVSAASPSAVSVMSLGLTMTLNS